MKYQKSLSEAQFSEALDTLRSGGVVVFPTETAYGLAADATNPRAVERLFAIKQRPLEKTLPLIASDRSMVERYVVLTPMLGELADRYWPGDLTVVTQVKADSGLSERVVKEGAVAVRVSSHPVAARLSRDLGRPITATSANLAGQATCYSIEEVKRQFAKELLQPDFFLDAGVLSPRLPSTIVREAGGEVEMLRRGEIEL